MRHAPARVPVEAARLEQHRRRAARDRIADERAAVARRARVGREGDLLRGVAAVRRDAREARQTRDERVGLRGEKTWACFLDLAHLRFPPPLHCPAAAARRCRPAHQSARPASAARRP